MTVLDKCGGKAVRAAVPHGRPRASRSGAADKHTSRRNCAGKNGLHCYLFHASNAGSQRRMPSACLPCRDRLSAHRAHKGGADGSGRPADPLVPAALPVARRFLLLLPPLPLLSAVVENLSTDEFLLKLACKQIYSLFEGPSSETPVSAETICRYTDLGNTVFFYRTLKFSRERALFALI